MSQFLFKRSITSLCLGIFRIYQNICAIAISINIAIIMISVRYFVQLSKLYLQTIFKWNISIQYYVMAQKRSCTLVVVSQPSWIWSQPKFYQFFSMKDFFSERKFKYVHWFLGHFGNRQQTYRQKDKQTQVKTLSPI